MNSEKILKEQLHKIEERQEKRYALINARNMPTASENEENGDKPCMSANMMILLIVLILSVSSAVVFLLTDLIIYVGLKEKYSFGEVLIKSSPLLGLIVLFSLLVYFSLRYIRIREEKLFDALKKVSKGDYDAQISLEHAGAYRKAYAEFNEMCDNLKNLDADLDKALKLANEASETKAKFLTNMSHEVRTPINAVLGLDEMILRESREPKIRGYASDIKSAGKTLMTFVNDVLDTSKLESGKLEIIPVKYELSSTINDIMNMTLTCANDKGLTFTIKVDEKTPHMLKGDEIRIKQCMLNILSNAVKYTDEGSITCEIGYAKLNESEILLSVSITDTGRGMRPEDMERLFTSFERIEENKNKDVGGLGLGMSITKNLLALMNSELRVDSKYGFGSTFKFMVKQEVLDWQPIGNIEESFTKLRDSEGKYKESFIAPNARVLVVDDSSVNLMIVEGLLKKTKMQLTLSESGEDAVNLSKKNKYDLILVDHMMPGMDGIETLHHMRKDDDSLNAESVIVALTANAVTGAKEYYLSEGFNDYLSKPIEAEKLEATIRNYLPKDLCMTEGWEEEPCEPDLEEVKEEGTSENDEGDFIKKLKDVDGIFPDKGIEYSGSKELYQKVLTEFADTGSSRANTIEAYFEQEDFRNYTIQVHALKSAARIIGATGLSQLAAALEQAGNEENKVKIQNATGTLLKMYRDIVGALEPIMSPDDDLPLIDEDYLKEAMMSLREMVEGFDFDSADYVMGELKKYKMPEDFKEKYAKLKTLVAEVARDDILELLAE